MGLRRKAGFTFIELIMVIIIIGVLAAGGTYLLLYLVQNGIFIPNKLNMDMLASDIMDILIEGEGKTKGLRSLKRIEYIDGDRIEFINQNDQLISFWLSLSPPLLYRAVDKGPWQLIPYYVPKEGVAIGSKSKRLFTYYDKSGIITNDPASVRAIDIGLIAQTGDGTYDHWEGRAVLSSMVAVKRY